MVPSSAKHSPMRRIITAAIAHENMEAGPAIFAAFNAPKSQPDPMMDPTPAKSRLMRPMSLRSAVCCSEVLPEDSVSVAITTSVPDLRPALSRSLA